MNIDILLIGFVLVWYFYLCILDIKYREMELYKILFAGAVNILVLVVHNISTRFCGKCLLLYFIVFLAWVMIMFINDKINNENFIGSADVNIVVLQILISGLIFQNLSNQNYAIMHQLRFIMEIMNSLFLGIIIIMVVVIIDIIKLKRKTGMKVKSIIKNYKDIPMLPLFIPWIYVNLINLIVK